MQTKKLSLEHLIKYPENLQDKAPVIFMFHGYGSDENDLFAFANELPPNNVIISVKAPYPMQPYGNAWYAIYFDQANGKFSDDEQAIASRDKIAQFIDEAIQAYPIDENNVTLLGFSQGSILSYAVALSYPEKINNIIALSGYVNENIIKKEVESRRYSHLHFYCSHGSQDQVVPVVWARKTKPYLDALGINNTYSEFPIGHGVSPENLMEVKKWLSQKI